MFGVFPACVALLAEFDLLTKETLVQLHGNVSFAGIA